MASTDTVRDAGTADIPTRRRGVPEPVRLGLLTALVALVVVVPLVQGGFTLYLATESIIRAIAAVGLGLLIAHAGLLSLGHAAFFGLAGYGVAFLATNGMNNPLLTLTIPVLAAVLYAAITGPLALRSHGIFFVMLTLAFAQVLYAVAEQWVEVTRGSDGIAGILRPDWVSGRETFYVFAVALLVFVIWIGNRLARAPVGRVVAAARQNELKTRAVGYPVFLYRYLVFLASAAITGLGGAMHVHHRGFVSPRELFWVTSGVLVLMVLLGGGRSLLGAAIGAVVFVQLESFFTDVTELWEMMVGFLLIGAVLTNYGRSIQSGARSLWSRVRRGSAAADAGRGD
ncbi:branched-chain amino acid ABC transporter permease [Egicoccus sp. AB-alg2]|uniref:branched-chain amino acid ABC transporter permease n=1 Tax=Egicoccus sp. AB-alg2 TaxID=3242693 RepID=UPI00359EFA9D